MYYLSLQSLRGIFALFIFFHHFAFISGGDGLFAAGGDSGVAFFFILSGFVMSQGYMSREAVCTSGKSFFVFIGKRFSKIYPLHLLCLAGAIAIDSFTFRYADIANVLLLQAWVPDASWYFSGNSVGWCLSDFLFFYSVFPLLCHAYRNHRKTFLRIYVIATVLFLVLIVPAIGNKWVDAVVYISPLTRLLDFIFGILLWEVYRSFTTIYHIGRRAFYDGISGLLCLIATIIFWYVVPSRYGLSILWWPASALLIWYAITSGQKVLSFKPLVWFGNISFSFYLIHVLAIRYIDLFLRKTDICLNPYVRLALILFLTVIAAWLIHKYFVTPIEKAIRAKLNVITT